METSIPTRETGERVIEVPSFTDPHKTYSTDPITGVCDCPRYEHRGYCAKHPILAEALVKSRALKYRYEREIGERVVTSLCKRIFAVKRESASAAYDLYLEVVGSRYGTARMRTAALRRHRRAYMVEMGRAA